MQKIWSRVCQWKCRLIFSILYIFQNGEKNTPWGSRGFLLSKMSPSPLRPDLWVYLATAKDDLWVQSHDFPGIRDESWLGLISPLQLLRYAPTNPGYNRYY